MNSSWKRPAYSLLIAAASAAAALFAVPSPAAAAGCPTTAVSEAGGSHWCYEHNSSKGHVHLWTPPGYKADTAVTVIYIHGYNNDEVTSTVRREDGSYIDRAWDSHKLAQQFADSKINALFIVPEGPIGNKNDTVNSEGKVIFKGIKNDSRYASVLWNSLSSLLTSVAEKGKIATPNNVSIFAHSAGMYTAQNLWSDAKVKHLASMDWVDGGLESAVTKWYKQAGLRKLTLVGGSGGQQKIMDRMSTDLPCPKAAKPLSLTGDEIGQACLYMRTSVGHMQVITGGKAMPQALKRATEVAADPTAPSDAGGGGFAGATASGSIRSTTLQDGSIKAPILEIPIPGLELSDAVRTNGQITIPWLAQYVGGVYTFLLSIVGLVAAVTMIVGGFQYVTSAGDKTKLGAGKKRIVDALSGLVLALSSYVILYAINPNLVSFDGLKVGGITTELYLINEDSDPASDHQSVQATGTASEKVEVSDLGFADHAVAVCDGWKDCDQWCRDHGDPKTWPSATRGMMPKDQTIDIKDYRYSDAFPGKSGPILVEGNGNRAHPKVRDALYAAAKQAAIDYPSNAYRIVVSECWRSLASQINKACVGSPPSFSGVKPDAPSAVAFPGGSNHGVGYACDLRLYDGNTNQIPLTSHKKATKAQCDVKRENSKRFDDIMFKVGWVRYEAEIWHYEFGSPADRRCGPNSKGGPEECVFPPKKFCS